MFLVLLKREILAHLITFRFAITVITCLLLVVITTLIRIDDYEQRLAGYNTARDTNRDELLSTRTYSFLMPKVDRPPNPLSIFNAGMDNRLGNTLRIYYTNVPVLWDAQVHSSGNIFIDHFYRIDLIFIFQFVLSLLALLFAYDAIAGERESGTMRLTMSHPVRRGNILAAKYFGAMTCLILPLIMSFIVALIWIVSTGSIVLSGNDFLRIAGILLTSIIYLSAIYLIGLFISAWAHRTATALMLSLFVWVVLVLVYPSFSVSMVDQLTNPVDSRIYSSEKAIRQILETVEDEGRKYRINDSVEGENEHFNVQGNRNGLHVGLSKGSTATHIKFRAYDWRSIDPESEKRIPDVIRYHQFLTPLKFQAAEKIGLERLPALEQTRFRRAKIARNLLRISPAATYNLATQAWTGTDLYGVEDFFQAARQYRRTLVNYFYDEGAFSSRQWFASDKGAIDLDDLPRFVYQRADLWTNALRALPDLQILLLLNVALFLATFAIFVRQEI
ncbi:MAG: ABC transporter permease subunit [Candidatus Poribacteria bacterium]|nr:ABC transporter permease subunit [Candidatus Poribacteria bacterium]